MTLKSWTCVLVLTAIIATDANTSAQDPNHELTISSAAAAPGEIVTLGVYYTNTSPNPLQGWSFGVAHDTSELTLVPDSVVFGATTATVKAGSPPDFCTINEYPNGWTVGYVICFVGCSALPPGSGYELDIASYTLSGLDPGESGEVCFSSALGMPSVAVVVVIGGQSILPVQNCGTVTAIIAPEFIRSDCNDDGINDVADGIFTIGVMFYGYGEACLAACDANADGMVDASDAVFTFNYQFLGGPAPVAPYPSCGEVGDDALGCDGSNCG